MRGGFLLCAAALAAAGIWSPAVANESAVGRLNHAGYRQKMHCTATLVAPDRALTAAHCVDENPAEMHFLPGYDRAAWREALRPSSAARAAPPRDVAVLCLGGAAETEPLPRSRRGPSVGERLTVVGYPTPQVHVQSRVRCSVTGHGPNGAFTLSCPMAPGSSGAPVLRDVNGGYEVVGVVSGTSAARSIAFDVSLGQNTPQCE